MNCPLSKDQECEFCKIAKSRELYCAIKELKFNSSPNNRTNLIARMKLCPKKDYKWMKGRKK